MKNYSLLLLLFCCSLFLNACTDKDDDPSKEDMLMNKRWQISALTVSSMLGSIDYYGSFQGCEKDNFIEFRAGGVMIDEGPTKCNATALQQTPGTWSLEGDVLKVNGIGAALGLTVDDLSLNIQELTNTNLVGAFTQTYSGFTFNGSISLKIQ